MTRLRHERSHCYRSPVYYLIIANNTSNILPIEEIRLPDSNSDFNLSIRRVPQLPSFNPFQQ